jgi:flagellar motor switch protein FliN/FliY
MTVSDTAPVLSTDTAPPAPGPAVPGVSAVGSAPAAGRDPAPPVDDPGDGRRMAVRETQFRSVTVEVSVWIGKSRRSFGDLAKLRPGDVIELDRAVGAPVDIVLNREVVIARGEVVDVGDEYGVRITEIVSDEDG